MNDTSRNTRTLIVSFVFAIMALIPLRFVEVGQMIQDQPMVLGDEVQFAEEVVLPESGISEEVALEAPYNEIEGQFSYSSEEVLGEETQVVESSCIPTEEAQVVLAEYETELSGGGLDGETTDQLVNEMISIESMMCK
ncbi:hypothetical protein HYV64_04010 [Candidatus Shapirobacteria bacterium]|nr:hypothetical protein [Candidatus Shapirobacteria bacterium]